MKKILITGISGFIGANIAHRAVAEGHEVHGLIKADSPLWRLGGIEDRVKLHSADLRETWKVSEIVSDISPEVIFHLAVHPYLDQDIDQIMQTNFVGTVNLLRSAEKKGFELFVNTGSSSEYGAKAQIMKETDVLEPNSYYAVTKAATSNFCLHEGRSKKLPIVTLRLFSVYGPYEPNAPNKRFLPNAIVSCIRNQDLPLVPKETVRDFIHVSDAVGAYFHFMKYKSVPGEVYNVATGRQHTINEVMESIMAHTGSRSNLHWGAYPRRPWDDAKNWQGDISKIIGTGWRPKYSLDEGIRSSVEWFKKNLDFYIEPSKT